MAQYIDKGLLLKLIKARRNELADLMNRVPYASNYPVWSSNVDLLDEIKKVIDTLPVKGVALEDYHKLKKVLAISFMRFLDENRPTGKMCLSDDECLDVEKAFNEMDFSKLFRYMEKYLNAEEGDITV